MARSVSSTQTYDVLPEVTIAAAGAFTFAGNTRPYLFCSTNNRALNTAHINMIKVGSLGS